VKSQRRWAGILKVAECGFFHLEVSLDVKMRGGWIFVAEPQCNDGEVHAGLKEVHCRGVAHMWSATYAPIC